ALALAAADADPDEFERNPGAFDIPDSVVGFMAGELGDLPGGWPEPFRTKVLEGRTVKIGLVDLSDEDRTALTIEGEARQRVLNRLLFPAPTEAFERHRETFGDLSVVNTPDYLYGLKPGTEHAVAMAPGVDLLVGLEAIGAADEKGIRTVMTTINGQLRPVFVRDTSIAVDSATVEKADAGVPGQVAAPFSGAVTLQVAQGDRVSAGQAVATIEAMKMEAAITSSVAGTVSRLAISRTQQVDAGDLLVVIEGA
ncbi:MAG TPA: biotin/lipoyl-containing protein, partial [Pseudolysinimonas sp.]|nr:biotin/lipoyl-containing protein [Pseudolysinimonas sp.]